MSESDFWVKASEWTKARFKCDYRASCRRPVDIVYVREGYPQHSYCYRHYLEVSHADE